MSISIVLLARLAATWVTPASSTSNWACDQMLVPLAVPWWQQWLPNTGCSSVANRFGLNGPRICHSTACASGLIDILSAVRGSKTARLTWRMAGSGEGIHPLFAAGFHRMGVLADHADPAQACRPFDSERSGFVMGEGRALFVIERLSHAINRGVQDLRRNPRRQNAGRGASRYRSRCR